MINTQLLVVIEVLNFDPLFNDLNQVQIGIPSNIDILKYTYSAFLSLWYSHWRMSSASSGWCWTLHIWWGSPGICLWTGSECWWSDLWHKCRTKWQISLGSTADPPEVALATENIYNYRADYPDIINT